VQTKPLPTLILPKKADSLKPLTVVDKMACNEVDSNAAKEKSLGKKA
jgi:hypothetical protein